MLDQTITLTDFVPYAWTENLNLQTTDFQVPVEHRPMLEGAKQLGLKIEFDGSFTQGLNIKDRTGHKVGHVQCFLNDEWLEELLKDLTELVNNPKKYGIA